MRLLLKINGFNISILLQLHNICVSGCESVCKAQLTFGKP